MLCLSLTRQSAKRNRETNGALAERERHSGEIACNASKHVMLNNSLGERASRVSSQQ